jgi:hypothetical protein
MAQPSAIADIEERLQDLIDALRQAGRPDLARLLERYANDFTNLAMVRRSVNAIQRQLELWRAPGSELPDTAKIQHAANRLEDVCKEALGAGVIVAARPSLGTHARRKTGVVLVTLLGAALVLLIGIALVESGVELDQIGKPPPVEKAALVRGEEIAVRMTGLSEALLPAATSSAAFEPLPGCKRPHGPDVSCLLVEPRAWANGRLPTYEIKLPNQAYGLLFSIGATDLMAGKIAETTLHIAATDDTPEGTYEIALRATYKGYTPLRCELLERLQGTCPQPRAGAGEQHTGVAVPPLVVQVRPGDPKQKAAEAALAAQEVEATQRTAAARARDIEEALVEIDNEVTAVELLGKKRKWEEARERLGKLGALFAPLDAASLAGEAPGELPADVGKVRARYEALHDALQAFEGSVFDATFEEVTAASNKALAEERIITRIAKRFHVSSEYVQSIYTDRAEEIQRRLDDRARVHLEKVRAEQQSREKRCGSLPVDAYKTVQAYAKAMLTSPRVEITLGECMTPRLTATECWEMQCDYQRKEEVAIERPKVVSKHALTVRLVQGRVVSHRSGS